MIPVDGEEGILEILNVYMDLAEKQEEVIYRLSKIVKRQAYELKHLRDVYGFFEENPEKNLEDENLAKEAMEQYEEMKSGEL